MARRPKTVTITEKELHVIADALLEANRATEFALNANHNLLTQSGRNKGFDQRYRYITLRSELFTRLRDL